MTGAELRCILVAHGLSHEWAAENIFQCSRRTLLYWIKGRNSRGAAAGVPLAKARALLEFVEGVDIEVSSIIERANRDRFLPDNRGRTLVLYVGSVLPLGRYPLALCDVMTLRVCNALRERGADCEISFAE